MPAIPVPQRSIPFMGSQHVFERGDRTYIQTPVQRFVPTSEEVARFTFAQAVQQEVASLKAQAPNENILWLKGQYVEADRANANGAEWRAEELRIKSLTPMLMPITVMHDPRTAVGVIADTVLREPGKDGVARTSIGTVLAVWAHRFPEVANEVAVNLDQGTLMQSMECYSPWYECSECGSVFHKLPQGMERASWCEHLRAAGHPDDSMRGLAGAQQSNASRILGDVCFTGTGLIFGTRGAKGAYSEAFLEEFQDELAQHFQTVHTETATTSPTPRSDRTMPMVQIEQSELDTLRKERDDARTDATAAKTAQQDADRKVTELEAQVSTLSDEKATAESKVSTLEEQANRATLKDTRWQALGEGFVAKLGAHTKARLEEKAKTLSETDWDDELKSVEEIAGIQRDAAKESGETPEEKAAREQRERETAQGPTFSLEEIAKAGGFTGSGQPAPTGAPSQIERSSVIGSLAGAFKS